MYFSMIFLIFCVIFNSKINFYMVVVAQMVRASDCGSEGYGFESRLPPKKKIGLQANQEKALA